MSFSTIMRYFIPLLMVFMAKGIFAQNNLSDNNLTNQLWISYDMSYKSSELTEISSEFGFKTIWPEVWKRYYIKPTIKFNIPKFMFKKLKYKESLSAGVGIYYTDNSFEENRLEIRPYQGYLLDWPNWTHLRLRHYLRLEERFDLNTSNWVNTFGLRLRYLLGLTIKLQGDIVPEAKGIYIPFSMEFFWNIVGVRQFNDVYRTSAGIGSNLSKKLRMEVRFGYQYLRNTTTEDFQTNDLIYQVRAFYRIN